MGVGLNTMLGAIGAVGVAASKVGSAAGQAADKEKAKKEKEANAKEAAAKEAKNAAIDEANMTAQLEGAELDDQILKKKQDQNFFAQGLARSEMQFAAGKDKKKKLTNLEALQKAREALDDEAKANNIRMNQIRTVMQLKGYGGKK